MQLLTFPHSSSFPPCLPPFLLSLPVLSLLPLAPLLLSYALFSFPLPLPLWFSSIYYASGTIVNIFKCFPLIFIANNDTGAIYYPPLSVREGEVTRITIINMFLLHLFSKWCSKVEKITMCKPNQFVLSSQV